MKASVAAGALLVLGLLQMFGHLARLPALRAIGAACGASPAPKVFSAVEGLETYSSRFYLEWQDAAGAAQVVRLTPERYARMRGPYNRRNVYGAALAYGPVLAHNPHTRAMFEQVTQYAFCKSTLLRELAIDAQHRTGPLRVRLAPLRVPDQMRDMPLTFEVSCDE